MAQTPSEDLSRSATTVGNGNARPAFVCEPADLPFGTPLPPLEGMRVERESARVLVL